MIYLYLIGCLGCLILQAFFCASEISYISTQTLRLQYQKDKGNLRAKRVYHLMSSPERFLATILIGTNLAIVLSSSFFTFFLMHLGVRESHWLTTIILTPIIVIVAELIPKNIGRFYREDFSYLVVGIVELFQRMFAPLVWMTEQISKFIIRLFLGKVRIRSGFVAKEEIKALIKEIEKEGGIDQGEKQAIEEVFALRHDKIKDVCVLLKDVVGIDYTDSYLKIIELANNNRLTRYPVFRNREIIGYLNIFDIFYADKKDWHEFIRTIPKVGINQKIYEVFTRLKQRKDNIALVLKGRKVYGVITLEDLIREILTSIVK